MNSTNPAQDDFLVFDREDGDQSQDAPSKCWKILVVDDEEDVHASTLLAVGRSVVCGRPLEFIHCYSAAEAKHTLASVGDVAVILLDVVMESDQAGLGLIEHIRDTLGMSDPRIILRTGQPGYAPELDVITRYEINDYKTKSELTRNKLVTAITAAVRAYAQIRALSSSRSGLEAIIEASNGLIAVKDFDRFAAAATVRISAIFGVGKSGLACLRYAERPDEISIVATTDPLDRCIGRSIHSLEENGRRSTVEQAFEQRAHCFAARHTALYFASPRGVELVVLLNCSLALSVESRRLLDVLGANISLCIANISVLDQLRRSAYLDPLIGIPNRLAFLEALDRRLTAGRVSTVAVLDIDHFSALNDTIGQEQGDNLLCAVGERLRSTFAGDVDISRIAGDTFGVAGPVLQLTRERVMEAFSQPFFVAEGSYLLSVTQGRVNLDKQTSGVEALAQANMALKRAKSTLRGGTYEFRSELLRETENRVQILQSLRKTFAEGRLSLAYQPKVDLKTGHTAGIEALMRWRLEDDRYVPPIEFIPIAEASGLIVLLGEWALRRALVTAGKIRDGFDREMRVAVNVSVVQFSHPAFVQMLDAALESTGADPSWLELEITESLPMSDLNKFQELIGTISSRGIKISIDDFGTGFSSLSYLEKLDIQALKIDRYFIDRLDKKPPQTCIPEAILKLTKSLGIECIAEGVETRAQSEWLRNAGCNTGQGYLYAYPMEEGELINWLARENPA